MATRYFSINKHDRKVVINNVEYKFTKTSRNHASRGWNGLIELPGGEQADALAEEGTKLGVWEVTEEEAIADIQKKSGSMNIIDHRPARSPESVKPAEVKEEVVESVESIDDLMSEPPSEAIEPESAPKVEHEVVEPTPEPVKRKPRKARKPSKK